MPDRMWGSTSGGIRALSHVGNCVSAVDACEASTPVPVSKPCAAQFARAAATHVNAVQAATTIVNNIQKAAIMILPLHCDVAIFHPPLLRNSELHYLRPRAAFFLSGARERLVDRPQGPSRFRTRRRLWRSATYSTCPSGK